MFLGNYDYHTTTPAVRDQQPHNGQAATISPTVPSESPSVDTTTTRVGHYIGMDETSTPNIDRRVPEETLDEWMDETDDVEVIRRLGFLKNLHRGDTVAEAIRREGKSPSTGYRWKDRWEDGGIEALMPETSGGRPPKLSEEQRETFREAVYECQPCTIDQLESLLEREFEVHFSRMYLQEYLQEHGFTYTKPALQGAIDDNSLSDIEWDTNQHPNTTARHPYNDQDSRLIARWQVAEES